ncbi:MAG: hypothetical protein OXB86_00555, partial [Bdellovibrionales bacterium]|nr:hypothetical protein [Bdellovibrionales bacterium]
DNFTEGSGTEASGANADRFLAMDLGNKNKSSSNKAKRKARKKRGKKGGMKDVKLKSNQNLSNSDNSGEMGVGYLGRISVEYEEEENDKPPPVFQAQAATSQKGGEIPNAQKKKNKLQVKKPGDGKKGRIEDLKPLSLGGYMKWLFIAVLLIAVILVIGSQILEFQNADT